ncbi:MAG: TonB-dependent receptor [Bacteroidales bacterium]|nr:TonB-dependent receptor [Bacteroidales bacterium]
MKKYFLLSLILIFSEFAHAETIDTTKMTCTCVDLEEVNISANLPLNDNKVAGFFRTNQFASMDNINARLEGMSLIKRGAYAMEPQLNGFSGGQINATIDGMKMFGACTDKMDPITSYIEPTNLKTLTISQGTSGCQNGCSLGGTFDMTLQEPDSKGLIPFYSSLGFGYESISRSKNVLFLSGFSHQKWAFGVEGVYRKNENYKTGENVTIPFSQFQKANLHSVLKYKPNSKSTFKADFLLDDARNVGYPALPMDVGVARASLFALEYTHQGKIQTKAKMYVNSILHVMDDSQRDSLYILKTKPVGKSDTVFMRMDMPGKSSTLGAYLQFVIPWNNRNKLMLKVDNYTNRSLAEMTMHMRYAGFAPELPMYMQTWPENLRNVSGIFIQNSTYVSENLRMTVDGRIDYNIDRLQSKYGQEQASIFNYNLSKQQSKLIKSINFSTQYQLVSELSILANIGYSERMPTVGERLGYYLYNAYDGYDYIGNPYLKAENSKFARLSLTYSKSNLQLNISQSFSFVNDYIMGITNSEIPAMNFYAKGIRVYSNVPSAKLYSTDLQLLYSPTKNLTTFLLSKFTYGELSAREPLPLISPLKNTIVVEYHKKTFSAQGECESALAQNRINTAYNETSTPGFTVFNLKSNYSISSQHATLDLSVGITNLFNKIYYEHLDWGRINRPGRSINLFVNYSY